MAKKKLFKSKTNFTLKRLHQSGSYGNIYERDYTTIANTGTSPEGQIPIYNSPSFKLSVRAGYNGQKKYKYGDWLQNPSNCQGVTNSNLWTLDCMPEGRKEDSKIILKPHTHRLTDFSCYGSATDLIRASLRDIVARFPAELYVTNKQYSNKGYIVDNPMGIDILQGVIPENSMFSPLRYFCESWNKYGITSWTVESITALTECLQNGDLLATVKIPPFADIKCYYHEGNIIYTTSSRTNPHIRPNQESINEFFDSLDDFEKILLNQYTDYTAKFETYEEDDENGWYFFDKEYQWPLGLGGWNIAVSGKAYTDYTTALSKLAATYDELFTDAIWRLMSHDAISNMDLTLTKNGEDIEIPNSSKVRNALSIIGRQFDEIKKYADNIKTTNTITYSQDSNTPDYFLSDNLELSGWEPQEIFNQVDESIRTEPMYGARTVGFTASDANNEFMRRLKLNSKQIFEQKGTKRGLEDLMAIFGYHSVDWIKRYKDINGINNHPDGNLDATNMYKRSFLPIEYVYVADGYAHNKTADEVRIKVQEINTLKDNFTSEDINNEGVVMNYYQGLPVAEVEYNGIIRLVPWFDKNTYYDGDTYFQMKGGWARNDGDGTVGTPSVYEKTVSKIHYVEKLSDLTDLTLNRIDEVGLYYVGSEQQYYRIKDISKFQDIERGWEMLTDRNEIMEFENIIDNNKGNNPHSGDYDGGISYLEPFGTLFKNATFNQAREEDVEDATEYGFDISRQADSTKCLFFGENYLDSDFPLRGENRIEPYDLFSNSTGITFNETASLSVINSKELHIIFHKEHKEFLEQNVLPYVKQIIPSTTIFSYSFEELGEDFEQHYTAQTHQVICNGGICPIMGIV